MDKHGTAKDFKAALRQLTYAEALRVREELSNQRRYCIRTDDFERLDEVRERCIQWAEVWSPALGRRLPFYKRTRWSK